MRKGNARKFSIETSQNGGVHMHHRNRLYGRAGEVLPLRLLSTGNGFGFLRPSVKNCSGAGKEVSFPFLFI